MNRKEQLRKQIELLEDAIIVYRSGKKRFAASSTSEQQQEFHELKKELQELEKADEVGSVYIEDHVKIFDPGTGDVIYKGRG